MTKKNFKETTKLNVAIKRLDDCEQRKSENGYFIVSENWGTCFFRVAHTRPTFEIQRFSAPVAERTYTKIPVAAYDNVYNVYINVHQYTFFTLNLPTNACVVGMSDPQQSGEFLNYSLLVYSPSGEPPTVTETEMQDTQMMIKHLSIEEPVRFTIYDLCPVSGYGKTGHIKRIAI